MIRIVLLMDLDDASRAGADRRVEPQAPPGYVVSELRCLAWSRSSRTGAVSWEFRFLVTTSPDGKLR